MIPRLLTLLTLLMALVPSAQAEAAPGLVADGVAMWPGA